MSTQRIIAVHQSLHRPAHMLGAERELVMFSALVALLVGIGGMTLISALTAFIFWVLALVFLRKMAKANPIMSKVWMRLINHQTFYSAKPSRWRRKISFKVKN